MQSGTSWLWRRCTLALVACTAGGAQSQGITAPVFEKAGVIDAGIHDVTVDTEGKVYFVGYHDPDQGTLDLDPGAGVTVVAPDDYESHILFVGKCSAQLDLEWLKIARWVAGGAGEIDPLRLRVAVDSIGNVLVGGAYSPLPSETIEFGEPGNAHTATFDANGEDKFVWKFNADGETEWVEAFAGEYRLRDIALDSGGGVYILGDQVVTKLGSQGNLEWAAHFDGSDGDAGYEEAFVIGKHDEIYVIIPFSGQIDVNLESGTQRFLADPNKAQYQILIVRLNADGDLVWGQLADSTTTSPQALLVDDSGGLLMSSAHGRLERHSPSGSLLWSQLLDQTHPNGAWWVEDIALGRDNDFYLTGRYDDTFHINAAAPNRSVLRPRGRFIARCTLDRLPLWTTQTLFIEDPSLQYEEGGFVQLFYMPDNSLLITAPAGEPIDADPSVHGMRPVVAFNDYDHRFVKYRSADEAWLYLNRAIERQIDGTFDFPQGTLANALRAIQPGQPINIVSPGAGTSSPEIGTFSKPTTISVMGAPVRIGVQP